MLLKLAWGNVRRSARDFAIYFITIALGVAVFYAFNSITDQEAVSAIGDASSIRELLNMVIRYVSVFIAVVLAFLVIYANGFLIRRRSKEFGMYLVMGMRTSQVLAIVGLETLIIGTLSVVIGFVAGFGCSQLLMMGTASLFNEELTGLGMGVSVDALITTIVLFAVIFFVAALLNARRIIATPLIGLLHAERKNASLVLRNLPLSVVLFIASVACIGYSYQLLRDNGLLEPSPQFLWATVLVCVGTWLFFYSLSGFLLKLVQMIRPLYLRGLNMFTLRQLNAKLNTTVASMTIVCIALFLSITSVCGGIGIVNAMNSDLDAMTAYDASVTSSWTFFRPNGEGGYDVVESNLGDFRKFAESQDYDMEKGLEASMEELGGPSLAALIGRSVQIDRWITSDGSLTLGEFEDQVPYDLTHYIGTSIENDNYQQMPLSLISLGQVNDALELAGDEPIILDQDQALIIYNSAYVADFWRQFETGEHSIALGPHDLQITGVRSMFLDTTTMPLDTGSMVVPDALIDSSLLRNNSVLDVQLKDGDEQGAFAEAMDAIQATDDPNTWPVSLMITKDKVFQQTSGLTGIVAFLAIYIGFILTIACAAILAIQQLSEASDNERRYVLLRKLGTPESMIATSLFVQIAIYFLAPLILAISHSICALDVVSVVIAIFGNLDIGETALITAGAFLITYGAYLLITYFTARRFTH